MKTLTEIMRIVRRFFHLVEGIIYITAATLALSGWEAAWVCDFLLGMMHLIASAGHEDFYAVARRCGMKLHVWVAGLFRL